MKRRSILLLLTILVGLTPVIAQQAASTFKSTPAAIDNDIAVFFSPKGHCTAAIVEQIENARKSVKVQAYSFTSVPIAEALMKAHQRGVGITVILDSSQRSDKYSSATFLFNQGIATYIDPNHAIAHNKVMLIDDDVIITGSFNFSKAAEESNAENLLIIRGKPGLLAAYQKNFDDHLAHSVRYEGKQTATAVPTTQPSLEDDKVHVHVTRSGKKYHRTGCRFLAKSDLEITLKEAKAKGYAPCSNCDPPQ